MGQRLSESRCKSLINGSPGRTRTADKVVNSHPLYQLSYRGMVEMRRHYSMLRSSPSLGLPRATACVQICDQTQWRLGDTLGVLGKIGGAEGGVAFHHLA